MGKNKTVLKLGGGRRPERGFMKHFTSHDVKCHSKLTKEEVVVLFLLKLQHCSHHTCTIIRQGTELIGDLLVVPRPRGHLQYGQSLRSHFFSVWLPSAPWWTLVGTQNHEQLVYFLVEVESDGIDARIVFFFLSTASSILGKLTIRLLFSSSTVYIVKI